MNVLFVAPGKHPCPKEIGSDLASMQAAVGGLIQAVYPFHEPVALVCNEEGKLLDLPLNRFLRHPETGEVYDIVAGPFFLCGAPPDQEAFTSLTPEQMDRFQRYFHRIEIFQKGGSSDV